MTLQERLRALAAQEERDVDSGFEGCSIEHTKAEREAADALDAQAARIKELEEALRELMRADEIGRDPNTNAESWRPMKRAAWERAREALKDKP